MPKPSQGERESASDPGSHDRIQEMDARSLTPPLPLLRAHRALRAMQPGENLRVITSYPESIDEFQALVRHVTGYELVAQDVVGDEFVHLLRRGR